MKKALVLGLVLVLILGMSATAMAGNGKGNQKRNRTENEVQMKERAGRAEQAGQLGQNGKGPKAVPGLSQGAVRCELVIDYKVPGDQVPVGTLPSGTMTLTATHGSKVQTFESPIPWGLSDEDALKYIMDTFAPMLAEAFGLEVNSFRLVEYGFDQETYVTTAAFVAIHGKAPVTTTVGEDEPGH